MPSRNLVRSHIHEYPPMYINALRAIARRAVPTTNEDFDDPPQDGPFRTRDAVRIYRARMHTLRELLRADKDINSPSRPLYLVLEYLTSRTEARLRPDGSEEFWIIFSPHPFVLSIWRNNPGELIAAKRTHDNFLSSIRVGVEATQQSMAAEGK